MWLLLVGAACRCKKYMCIQISCVRSSSKPTLIRAASMVSGAASVDYNGHATDHAASVSHLFFGL